MAALSRRLQAQNSQTYQSQQPSPFYKHEKPEFLSGLMGPRTFLLSFSDRLLSR